MMRFTNHLTRCIHGKLCDRFLDLLGPVGCFHSIRADKGDDINIIAMLEL